ncbi:hypothetical protein [Trueperella pyogenes]|uniref:hypothetical protein n=1 Tax=Trueperella pyogenes TaxID=1661 RepID=UPI0013DEA6BA|nr:hypothetical protein [Trueperella pyogenes]MCI7689202.1 hypothetical protein [Trueperella pyogenes]
MDTKQVTRVEETGLELNQSETALTPDGSVNLPAYVPNMAETIKASGAHRQGSML